MTNPSVIRNMQAEDLKKVFQNMCRSVQGKFSTKGAFAYSCRFGERFDHRIQLFANRLDYSILKEDKEEVLLQGVPVRTIETGQTPFGFSIIFKVFPHTRKISITKRYDDSFELVDKTMKTLGIHTGMPETKEEGESG